MTPAAMAPQYLAIGGVRRETDDTFTIEMNVENGWSGFLPGQFNMLYLHGVGEVPISISGDPGKPQTIVHTTRAVGAVTHRMAELRKGDRLLVRGPFGTHWPVEEASGNDVLIIAGGIGLAPLRPAIYSVLANRSKYGKVVLMYGTRSPEDLIFRKEVESWRARFDMEVSVTVENAMGDWHGRVGFVTNLIPRATFDPPNTCAMICGPEVMMRFTATELLKRGMEMNDIYVSMERNMKCAIGFCGHCQFGPKFVCKDGPVFPYSSVVEWLSRGEI